ANGPALIANVDAAPPKPRGVILVYPYCGIGARSRFADWTDAPETLALIAGKDTIVNAEECQSVIARLNKAGGRINAHVYPEAEHVFDDPTLEPEYQHWYREEDAKDAIDRVTAFLEGVGG
ncbi:MAG: dienelactone hydrolase family protein, partial [Pseudomonadota bacterium]